MLRSVLALAFTVLALPLRAADEPLHVRIDRLIEAGAGEAKPAALADDAEFLRRVWLDLAGTIPTAESARAFLADQSPDKRAKLIDKLLASPEHARRLAELTHVMLMERRGDSPEWSAWLRESFAANKPWNEMVREMLCPDREKGTNAGAAFFLTKRLENYGQNPVDHPGLTRDVGRMFLGIDLQCAQCHNHLFVEDYRQKDFQGLHIVYSNLSLAKVGTKSMLNEKAITAKMEFQSVFNKQRKEVGPKLPDGPEFEIPKAAKGQEWRVKPDPKTRTPGIPVFSPLEKVAQALPTAENKSFVRNSVNRFWFAMMGRGLVHPLDLHHSGNPASHPELLDLLANEFAASKFDVRKLLREMALSKTYQRSSILPAGAEPGDDRFLVAIEKRVSAEQLLWSTLTALDGAVEPKAAETLRATFVKAFANPPAEPEDRFAPSLQSALFVLNDAGMLARLQRKAGNVVDRAAKLSDEAAVDEIFLSVLTRFPAPAEKTEAMTFLTARADRRDTALSHLAWALLASTEFCVNH